MYELVTLGETMAVIVPNSDGALSGVESFCLRIAGAESNTAIGVSRLGHSALWISALGDDEMGRYVRSNIAVEGVDVSAVVCDGAHRTGLMLKEFLGDTTNV
jgi:2-dehydro-3-deoxygluconokinase